MRRRWPSLSTGWEDLGLPNGARILTTSIGETVVDGKRRGGDGGADDVRRRAWDRNGGDDIVGEWRKFMMMEVAYIRQAESGARKKDENHEI